MLAWAWPQLAALVERCAGSPSLATAHRETFGAASILLQCLIARRAFASATRLGAFGWLATAVLLCGYIRYVWSDTPTEWSQGQAQYEFATMVIYGVALVLAAGPHARRDAHSSADSSLVVVSVCAVLPTLTLIELARPTATLQPDLVTFGFGFFTPAAGALVGWARLASRHRWLAEVGSGRRTQWRIVADTAWAQSIPTGLTALTPDCDSVLVRVAAPTAAYREAEGQDAVARVRAVPADRLRTIAVVEALGIAVAATTWPLATGLALLRWGMSRPPGEAMIRIGYAVTVLVSFIGYALARRPSRMNVPLRCACVGAALATLAAGCMLAAHAFVVDQRWWFLAMPAGALVSAIPSGATGAAFGWSVWPIIDGARAVGHSGRVGTVSAIALAHAIAGVGVSYAASQPVMYPAIVGAVAGVVLCVAMASRGSVSAERA